jgi:uncharacterized protein with ParB-like and HNH nuclease domain
VSIPDYQRAFSWEEKQINLFIQDVEKYSEKPQEYYFGHFISEKTTHGLEIVDGQQRITTCVIFLIVCRYLNEAKAVEAYKFIDKFSTVKYDHPALKKMAEHLPLLLIKRAKKTSRPRKRNDYSILPTTRK